MTLCTCEIQVCVRVCVCARVRVRVRKCVCATSLCMQRTQLGAVGARQPRPVIVLSHGQGQVNPPERLLHLRLPIQDSLLVGEEIREVRGGRHLLQQTLRH